MSANLIQINTNLQQTITFMQQMQQVYYDLFINTSPSLVSVQTLDSLTGQIITIQLPNWASLMQTVQSTNSGSSSNAIDNGNFIYLSTNTTSGSFTQSGISISTDSGNVQLYWNAIAKSWMMTNGSDVYEIASVDNSPQFYSIDVTEPITGSDPNQVINVGYLNQELSNIDLNLTSYINSEVTNIIDSLTNVSSYIDTLNNTQLNIIEDQINSLSLQITNISSDVNSDIIAINNQFTNTTSYINSEVNSVLDDINNINTQISNINNEIANTTSYIDSEISFIITDIDNTTEQIYSNIAEINSSIQQLDTSLTQTIANTSTDIVNMFSIYPTPNGIPQADSNGTLNIGWVQPSILVTLTEAINPEYYLISTQTNLNNTMGIYINILDGINLPLHNSLQLIDSNTLYILGGTLYLNGTNEINEDIFSVSLNNSTTNLITTIPEPLSNFSTNATNGNIYIIGGENNTSAVNTLYEYNIANDNWTTLDNLPQPIYNAITHIVNGSIYVIGGQGSPYVYIYNISTDTWTTASNATPVIFTSNSASTVMNGNIYVAGGYNESNNTFYNSLYEYNISTDTWTLLNSIPESLVGATMGSYNNLLYLFGGITSSGSVSNSSYVYNNNQWNAISGIPNQYSYISNAISLENNIVLLDILYNANNVNSLYVTKFIPQPTFYFYINVNAISP